MPRKSMHGSLRSRRVVVLGAAVLWHALLVWALLQIRGERPVESERVTVWLRLDEPRRIPEPQVPAPTLPPEARIAVPTVITLPEPPVDTARGSATIDPPADPRRGPVDWYAEATRAAEAFAERQSVQPRLDGRPRALALPERDERPRAGDTVTLEGGEQLVYTTDRCFFRVPRQRPPPGSPFVPVLECKPREPALDAEKLEERRPAYLDVPGPAAPR